MVGAVSGGRLVGWVLQFVRPETIFTDVNFKDKFANLANKWIYPINVFISVPTDIDISGTIRATASGLRQSCTARLAVQLIQKVACCRKEGKRELGGRKLPRTGPTGFFFFFRITNPVIAIFFMAIVGTWWWQKAYQD